MIDIHPVNGETWVICGGREFSDSQMFDRVMSDLMLMRGCPTRIVHGKARGADTLAQLWAERMAIECIAVPADWKTHGYAAGPLRNKKMLDEYRPQAVIAFPGGRGTADMVARAKKTACDVIEIKATEAAQ